MKKLTSLTVVESPGPYKYLINEEIDITYNNWMTCMVSMNISQMKKLTSLTVIGSPGKYKHFTNEEIDITYSS